MNILLVGDICGKPGRVAAKRCIPSLRKEYAADLVVANGENAAGGNGLTKAVLDELYGFGVDVVTTGNHIWDKKEIFQFIDREERLVRPANYPPGAPGRGYVIVEAAGRRVAVVNLSGSTFMPPIDCPFRKMDEILTQVAPQCDVILLDFHAETTSEKMAMGWYLDGKATCVVGTHTHIQTADERILPGGTAYISDLGMVGPWNSVLGVKRELVLKKFLSAMPVRFELADGPSVFCGVVLTLDAKTGRAQRIRRVQLRDTEIQ